MADLADARLVEKLALAAVGAVVLTAERLEVLADELAARGGLRRDEAKQLLDEVTSRWRGDSLRLGERAGESVHGVLGHLGVVTQEQVDDLELRLAQVEHRLRLLEDAPPPRRG